MTNYYQPHYKHGEWKACCDRCGQAYHSGQLKEEWTGYMVCNSCWDPRHPQDMVRGIPDDQTPPWTRPRPDLDFVDS